MASTNHASKIRDSTPATIQIFIKDLRDRHGKKRPLTIRSWSTIKDVKDQLQQLLHVPPSAQRLYYGPLLISGKELPNHRSLHDAGIYKSGETLLLDIKGGSSSQLENDDMTSLRASGGNDICISSSMLDSTPKGMTRIIQQARRGLMMGLKPILVLDGSGGTYFLHDARKVKIAVFKPADEEPYAENNPRGYVKQHDSDISLREGIRPGEACLREVAAFLLDHDGFASVPMTTLAEARHPAFHVVGGVNTSFQSGILASPEPANGSNTTTLMKKVGSCQEFVRAEDTMDDLSPSMLSVDEVHKIAILDIRLMNADRNAANLLVRRRPDNSLELVPIDHGYCLRSVCDVVWFDWCWLDWPQLKKPLSEKSREYILNLDIDADVRLLQESLQIGTEALDFFRASTKILQAGVKAGLSLYDIAVMCCRYDDAGEISSKLEVLSSQAKDLALCALKNERWGHVTASRAIAEQISHSPTTTITSRNLNDLSSSSTILKSKSLANFSSFSFDLTTAEESPASAQTSGSESSTNEEDAHPEEEPNSSLNEHKDEDDLDVQEDCQEWAAGIVADVDIENIYRPRSLSENSTESNSSAESSSHPQEPGSSYGFWRVRPGDDTVFTDTASWTPSSSPSLPSMDSRNDMASLNGESDPIESKHNVTFVGISLDQPIGQPTPDSSARSHRPNGMLNHQHSLPIKPNSTNEKPQHSLITTPPSLPTRPTGGGLVRSHSYSAFSFRDLTEDSHAFPINGGVGMVSTAIKPSLCIRNRSNTTATDSDIFKLYFHKFVDLLIERETIASARRKNLKLTDA